MAFEARYCEVIACDLGMRSWRSSVGCVRYYDNLEITSGTDYRDAISRNVCSSSRNRGSIHRLGIASE